MLSLLFYLYAVESSSVYHASVSSLEVNNGEESVVKSVHHVESSKKSGKNVSAHETTRAQERRKTKKRLARKEILEQKAGKKIGERSATKRRLVEGTSIKPEGQQERGKLTVTTEENAPATVASIDFSHPTGTPTTTTTTRKIGISAQGRSIK